nr:ArsA-related P-loop ATPase [Prescottella sp. R16]
MFVGKGGAGRTTLAAATAVALAAAGRRVLLASLDQAHALSDVLDRPVGRGTETRIGGGLDAVEIDTLGLLEQRYRGLIALLAVAGSHDHGDRFTDLAPEELTGLPGVEDLLGLGEIVRLAGEGRWDVVVVDCPPTADALRTLALPGTVTGYVERLWPQHRRVAAATSSDPRAAFAAALVDRVVDGADAAARLLADRDRTALRVVSAPGRIAAAETRRVLSAAALTGLRVDAVIMNNSARQDDPMAESRVDAAPVLAAARAGTEPIGWDALAALAASVYPEAGGDPVDPVDPAGTAAAEPSVRVTRESGSGDVESVYAMRMHLPVVDPGTLTLGRVEDDLLVGADGRRRRIRLASVLRRCTVTGADFDGTDLVVRFVPDPAVWPQ